MQVTDRLKVQDNVYKTKEAIVVAYHWKTFNLLQLFLDKYYLIVTSFY